MWRQEPEIFSCNVYDLFQEGRKWQRQVLQVDFLNLKTSCTPSTISRFSAVRHSCLADKLVMQTLVIARGKKICILTNRFMPPSAGKIMFSRLLPEEDYVFP